MIFLIFLSFFSSRCDRGIQLLKTFGNCFSVWPELSELPLVVISHYGYEKGRQLTAFVCLVEFSFLLYFYISLSRYPVYFVSGFWFVFFLILFIMDSEACKKRRKVFVPKQLLLCAWKRVAGHFAERSGR